MTKPKLEIACFNLESVAIAQGNGADRIELCDGYEMGGVTPSVTVTKVARSLTDIDLYVMVRPREGNFVYSDDEFEQMKQSITALKQENVDGFVFGILNKDKTVNTAQNKALVDLAAPLPCTFHRAFDEVPQAFLALKDIIDCGFRTVLASGMAPDLDRRETLLEDLVKNANNRIVIMPGGGVRSSNIRTLLQTGASWFHSSAIIDQEREVADSGEISALKSYLNGNP